MFSALRHLMQELGLKSGDWARLTTEDKNTLKTWADEEAAAFAAEGHPISNA